MGQLESSPERPVPVRVVAAKIGEWIHRLGEVWIDGQIAQLTRRPGMPTQFLVLRDPDANISLSVTCPRGVLDDTITEGSRVLVRARPDFWLERGTLSMRAAELRPVGLGELLARLERLKRLLAAEGIFATARKRPLPFLPRRIGLVTGRASAAERDVIDNARRRLPAARFRIENVAVQGPAAVLEIVAAITRLDADPDVEVIVVARGGGSVEDLLPFSNETLIRAVFACRTPVVSAVGHETDRPLLDLVSDLAASTPTDAGKRIVPDLCDELRRLDDLRQRARSSVRQRLQREAQLLAGLPTRLRVGILGQLTRQAQDVTALRERARRHSRGRLDAAAADLEHVRARIRSLSPQATLDRGYAVVLSPDGVVVRDADDAEGRLRIRVARGTFMADVTPVDHEGAG